MLGRVAAGVAGLGLIGGAGTVVYNGDGDATVSITNEKTGQVQTVQLAGDSGRSFSCPDGTQAKIEPYDIRLGRIQLTLTKVRRQVKQIERKHPGRYAPAQVIERYEELGTRDDRLVAAYNAQVDLRNSIIDRDCTPN